MKPCVRPLAILGLMFILVSPTAWFPSIASAQGLHQHGPPSSINAAMSIQDLAAGIAHGATLGAVVFLAGLVMFVSLVWLPTNPVQDAEQGRTVNLLCGWMWVLVGLLIVAALVELPLYAVRASGEGLSLRLLEEALFDTRVGHHWILRLTLAILTATVATYAANRSRPEYAANLRRSASTANRRRSGYWWGVALIVSALLLLTLTQQSHAAAEGHLLPFAADWLHLMAASLWMGGLLGFPILLIGPIRAMPTETRATVLGRTVPHFSKVATTAVMSLILTGLVAVLLHVPSLSALITTAYGRALSVKLGLLVFLLALGAQNLRLRGKGPFGRFVGAELMLALGIFVATGFLTSLPPANVAQPVADENEAIIAEGLRQPPPPIRPDAPKTAVQSAEEGAGTVLVRLSGTPGTAYSGVYGGSAADTTTVEGTLGANPKDYEVKGKDGIPGDVSAVFKKTRAGAETLEVEIVADGEVVAERETSEEAGTVALSWSPQAATARESP